jgi:hypothetical protein
MSVGVNNVSKEKVCSARVDKSFRIRQGFVKDSSTRGASDLVIRGDCRSAASGSHNDHHR